MTAFAKRGSKVRRKTDMTSLSASSYKTEVMTLVFTGQRNPKSYQPVQEYSQHGRCEKNRGSPGYTTLNSPTAHLSLRHSLMASAVSFCTSSKI